MQLHLINFNSELFKDPMPPLGLLALYAYLKEKGFTQVDVLDLLKYDRVEIQKQQFQKYVKDLAAGDRHIFGFYMNSHNRFEVKECVEFAKRSLPGSITIAGGPHPTLAPEDTLRSIPGIDILVKGEGEIILYNLIEKLRQDFSVGAVKDVKGISYRHNGRLFDNGLEKRIEELDALPFPDRKAVDMSTYRVVIPMVKPIEGLKTTTLMSSRGCPYKCIFCSVAEQWGRLNTYRNPPAMLKELDYLNKEFGYNAFYFFDDTFTVHRNRTVDFCRLLIKEKREYYWFCEVRANTVDRELLELMYEAGCRSITMGVESGSQKLLDDVVLKGIDLRRVKEIVKWCNELGIYIKCCFSYSYPGETLKQVEETLTFRGNLPADKKPMDQIRIYPGTPVQVYAQKHRMMPEDFTWFEKYSFYRTHSNPSIVPLFADKLSREQLTDIRDRLNPACSVKPNSPAALNALKRIKRPGDVFFLMKSFLKFVSRSRFG